MVKTKDLIRRIDVFSKFKGIAKAIQMVAITKLKRLEYVISTRQLSIFTSKELFLMTDLTSFSFFRNRNILFPITSDRQCCGIINSKVIGATLFLIQKHKKNKNNNILIFVIGNKGISGLSRVGLDNEIEVYCDEFKLELVSLYTIYILILSIIELGFDRLIIIFNKFFSLFDQRVALYKIPSINLFDNFLLTNNLSISFLKIVVKKTKKSDVYYIYIYIYVFFLILLDSFEENEYSELGSRAVAMENTWQNVTTILEELKIKYNKIRQSKITNDLVEVTSAAEFILN